MNLAKRELDALTVAAQIDQLKTLGSTLIKSGLLPKGVGTPEAAVTLILKGRELGIPPMQAIHHIHVINGKPTLSAELMLAMALNAGHEVWVDESTAKQATVKGVRRGSSRTQSLTFTLEEAKAAGVMNNPTWQKYPAAMLRARAISAFMRMFAPDVLMGASYVPEELGARVEVADDGEITVAAEEEPIDAEYSEPAPERLTRNQATALVILLKEAGFDDKKPQDQANGREFIGWLAGRSGLTSVKDLTFAQASAVLDQLGNGENGNYRADKGKVDDAVQRFFEEKASREADQAPVGDEEAAGVLG